MKCFGFSVSRTQKISEKIPVIFSKELIRRNEVILFICFLSLLFNHRRSNTTSRLQILKIPVMTGRCKPSSLATKSWLAEEQERLDRAPAYKGALYYAPASVHIDLPSPTQTNDSTCQIDHDTGAYVIYSFRTMLTRSFTSPSNWSARIKETRPAAKRHRPTTRSSELRRGFEVMLHGTIRNDDF